MAFVSVIHRHTGEERRTTEEVAKALTTANWKYKEEKVVKPFPKQEDKKDKE